MSKDLENIARIERKIGIILKRYTGSSLFRGDATETYRLDGRKNVVGLNLSRCSLADISSLKLLPNLTRLYLSENQITDISVLKYSVSLLI